jgi:tetratricopeptide (TPR) repeat protein
MKISDDEKRRLRFLFSSVLPFIKRDYAALESISRAFIQHEKTTAPIYHETLIYSLKKQNKTGCCVDEYRFLLKQFPEECRYYYDFIRFLYRNAKYAETAETCKTCLALPFKKESPFIIRMLKKNIYWYAGYAAFHLGRFSEASSHLEKYVHCKRAQQHHRHYEIIGYGYLLKKQFGPAKACFTRAIQLNKKSKYAQDALKYIAWNIHKIDTQNHSCPK